MPILSPAWRTAPKILKNHLYSISPSFLSFVAMELTSSSFVTSMVAVTGSLLNAHISFASSQPTPARIADTATTKISQSRKRRSRPLRRYQLPESV